MSEKLWPYPLMVFVCGLLMIGAMAGPPASICRADASSLSADPMEMQRNAYQSQRHLIKAVQKRLDALGYRPGPLDGAMGPKTKAALMAYQRDNGLKADGLVGIETLEHLGLIRKPISWTQPKAPFLRQSGSSS